MTTTTPIAGLCSCGETTLRANVVPVEKDGFTHYAGTPCVPHVGPCAFSCPVCGELFRITGDTAADRARAEREWPGCCIPNTPEATATHDVGEHVVSGATSWSLTEAGVTVSGFTAAPRRDSVTATYRRPRRSAPSIPLPSWLSGVPAWVARRAAVGGAR